MLKRSELRRAFTLIELLVVVSIIGMLASIVLVSLSSARDKANMGAGMQFSDSTLQVLGADAVGIYGFNDCSGTTVSDFGAYNNVGTIVGAVWETTNTPSGRGCSMRFHGESGATARVTMNVSQLSDDQGAVVAWAYPVSVQSNRYVFSTVGALTNRVYLSFSSGNFSASRGNPATSITMLQGVPLDKWYHIGLSWNGNVMTVYLNGRIVGSTTYNKVGGTFNTGYIGNQNTGSTNTFPGFIDDVRIYSSYITASDMESIFAEGAAAHGLVAEI